MKLLLNENLGRSVAEELRERGHDVLWIGEGFARTQDNAVMAKAAREGRVLVTKDKDFGELAFKTGQAHRGIILLRLRDESPANTIRVLLGVLPHVARHRLPYFVVAEDSGFRIRGPGPII